MKRRVAFLGGGIDVQTVRYAQLHGRQGLGFGAANLIRPTHACASISALSPSLSASSGAGSISKASRSFIALAYSVRFSRCSVARPGIGLAAAARSIEFSKYKTNPSEAAGSGWGIPAAASNWCEACG